MRNPMGKCGFLVAALTTEAPPDLYLLLACAPGMPQAGRSLAKGLAFAHFANSHLICRCTGEAMDGDNPPVALPNGQVYSRKAVNDVISSNGVVTCPQTGETFPASQAQSIFII